MGEKGTVRWGILSTANIGRAAVIPAIKESSTGHVIAGGRKTRALRKAVGAERSGVR